MTSHLGIILAFVLSISYSGTQAKQVQHKKQHLKHHLQAKSEVNAQSDENPEIGTITYDVPTAIPAIPAIPVNPSNGFPRVFPVEVDMSHFMSTIEERLSSLERSVSQNLARITENVNQNQASISANVARISENVDGISQNQASISANVASISANQASISENVNGISMLRDELNTQISGSRSFCQQGVVGCYKSCGGKDEGNTEQVEHYKETVTFPTPFPSTPAVNLALSGIYMKDPNGDVGDWYGWKLYVLDITTTSFLADLRMVDYEIRDIHGTWIACVTV